MIHRASAALLSAAAAAINPGASHAAGVVSWQGGSGNWDNLPSWSTATQPNTGDYVVIGQNYATVTYVNTALPNAVLQTLNVDATNTATLTMTQHVLNAEQENIGKTLNGAMAQSGGINNVTGGQGLYLGYYAGSSGAYTLSGSGVLNVSFFENVGRLGTGIFTQTGGTHNVSGAGHTLTIGDGPTGAGTYNFSGGTLHTGSTNLSSSGAAATFTQSGGTHTIDQYLEMGDSPNPKGPVLYTLSNAGILIAAGEVIGSTGPATFTQTGGSNTCSTSFRLGNGNTGVGTYNLSGGTMNIKSECLIGNVGQGIFNATGGKLTLDKAMIIGSYASSTSSFNMSNGASVQVQNIYLANNAVGSVNITGGTLNDAGTFDMAAGNGTATVNLSGGSLTSATLTLVPDINGKATFNHSGGVNTVTSNFNIGQRGTYNLSGGALTTANTTIYSGGAMNITGGQFKTATLAFDNAASGFINVSNESFVVDYAQFSTLNVVKAAVTTAYSNGTWTGPGIQSTTAAADNSKSTAVGYGEASKVLGLSGNNTAQWQGQTVDASSVLVRFTKYGDANLDGAVGFADLVKIAQNYNTQGSQTWADGDFNYDNNVDFQDLIKIAQNYNSAIPAEAIPGAPANFQQDMAAAFASVPEPGAAMLLLGATSALGARRRRK